MAKNYVIYVPDERIPTWKKLEEMVDKSGNASLSYLVCVAVEKYTESEERKTKRS